MKLTLGQAAKECGISKGTLSKAIKNGRLSAERQPDNSFLIDPAELFRVFPRKPFPETSKETIGNPQETGDNKALETELRLLRERLAEKDELIGDLRHERDRLLKVVEEQAGSMRLLTDQRAETAPARSGLFGWFRRQQ